MENRNLKDHHLRDGTAFRELSVPLDDRGGRYDTLFRNGPASSTILKHNQKIIEELVDSLQNPLIEEVVEYREVDTSFLKRGQLLVVSTRIPMNDLQQRDKVRVQPGFTSLEQTICRVCRPYLPVCARSRVRLADPVAAQLRPDYASRADIRFSVYSEPWYAELRGGRPEARSRNEKIRKYRTAVYLLQLPGVEELNGADLLVMWGQGGTQTLAFAQRLRSDVSFLLDWYGLSMVELVGPEMTERFEPFTLLDSMRRWDAHVLLRGVLLDRDGQRVLSAKPVQRKTLPTRDKKVVRQPGPGARQAGRGD